MPISLKVGFHVWMWNTAEKLFYVTPDFENVQSQPYGWRVPFSTRNLQIRLKENTTEKEGLKEDLWSWDASAKPRIACWNLFEISCRKSLLFHSCRGLWLTVLISSLFQFNAVGNISKQKDAYPIWVAAACLQEYHSWLDLPLACWDAGGLHLQGPAYLSRESTWCTTHFQKDCESFKKFKYLRLLLIHFATAQMFPHLSLFLIPSITVTGYEKPAPNTIYGKGRMKSTSL